MTVPMGPGGSYTGTATTVSN